MGRKVNEELPSVSFEASHSGSGEDMVLNHPAFGVAMVTHPRGGLDRMFGSRVLHDSRVQVTISTASVRRALSNDWHSAKDLVVELEFTEAQWARFVSSEGMCPGTPCTFRHLPTKHDAIINRVPDIAGDPDARPDFHDEMRRVTTRSLSWMDDMAEKIEGLVKNGKAGKKDLEALLVSAVAQKSRFISDTAFVAKQFKEHMEDTVTEAIVDIEAFAANYAKDLGFQELAKGRRLEQIEDKGTDEV